jgi:hypothetical protein
LRLIAKKNASTRKKSPFHHKKLARQRTLKNVFEAEILSLILA